MTIPITLPVLACFAVLGSFRASGASERSGPASPEGLFSTITVELSALDDVNDDTFQSYWDLGMGGEIAALSPVPHGFLEIAAHPFANDARGPGLPDVPMLATWLGWGANVHLPRAIVLRASARTGVAWMIYESTESSAEQDENELAFGARATIHVPLARTWSLHVGLRAAHILTHDPIDLVFAGGGVAYSFATPSWLRWFLE
jgi:hypothetical protein